MSTLKTIYRIYKPFLSKTSVILLLLILSMGAGFAIPYFFGQIVSAVTNGEVFGEIWKYVAWAFLASMVSLVISYVKERYDAQNIDFDVNSHFQYLTLYKTEELSVSQHMSENSGKLQSVVNSGENAAKQITNTILYSVMPTFVQVLLAVILCAFINIYVALVLLVSVILLVLTMIWFHIQFRSRLNELDDVRHQRNTLHTELLRNLVLVKLFGSNKKVVSSYRQFNDSFISKSKNIWVKIMGYHLIHGSFVSFVRIATIAVALTGVFNGHYDIGDFVVLFAWVQSATSQLDSVYWIQRQFTDNLPKAEKYVDFLSIKPDITFGTYIPKQINGDIEFKNVEFVYRNKAYLSRDKSFTGEKEVKALKGLSFFVSSGQTVALVGPSGAGKSTVVQMILGAYLPEKGDVLIDGKSLSEYDIDSLRQFIGYVPQQIDPFDDTIRANIELGLPENKQANNDTMKKAVEVAALEDVIKRAPKGLDTKIGEKGIKLSGGERQRLGIARALIRDPRILIFDEATSNLDTKNEKLITEAVQKIAKERTTLIIAHRLATVAHADKIIFVKDGKVAAEGTHKELLEFSPDYRELVEHQLVLG